MTSATKAGGAAALVAVVLLAALAWRASHHVMDVGFWFDVPCTALPSRITEAPGGPLTDADVTVIEQVARQELTRAFAGLRCAVRRRPALEPGMAVPRCEAG